MRRIVHAATSRRIYNCLAPLARVETIRFFTRRNITSHQKLKTSEAIEFLIPSEHEIAYFSFELNHKFNISRSCISDRFNRGNRVVLAVKGSKVVAMLWIAFESQMVSEVNALLRLRTNEFVTFHAVTLPEWRNLGLSTLLNEEAYLYASMRQRPVQLSWRSTHNHTALSVARKLGQTPVSEATALWLCNKRVWINHQHGDNAPILVTDQIPP